MHIKTASTNEYTNIGLQPVYFLDVKKKHAHTHGSKMGNGAACSNLPARSVRQKKPSINHAHRNIRGMDGNEHPRTHVPPARRTANNCVYTNRTDTLIFRLRSLDSHR